MDVLDTLRRYLVLGREVTNLERLLGIDRDLTSIVAHDFGVGRLVVLLRLHSLGFMPDAELERLKVWEEIGSAQEVAPLLGLPASGHNAFWDALQHRSLSLALDVIRQDAITRAKLQELALMVDLGPEPLARLFWDMELGDRKEEGDVLVPEA